MAGLLARLRELAHRLGGAFRRGRSDADIEEELRAHLEMAAEAAGRSDDDGRSPRRRAVSRHGALAPALEAGRDQRGWPWLADLVQDLSHFGRQLRREPGFAAATVLSLALGIGATTAAFSAIDAFLLRRLPVANPDQLVELMWNRKAGGALVDEPPMGAWIPDVDPATGQRVFASFSQTTLDLLRTESAEVADVFGLARLSAINVYADRQADLVDGLLVSGNYYGAIGITPLRGRVLQPADDRPDAPPVAVISERYWRNRFGGDPATVGRTLVVNQMAVTVVGIAAGFEGVMSNWGQQDITLPLALAPTVSLAQYGRYSPSRAWFRVLARLRPGATPNAVRDRLNGAFAAKMHDDELTGEGETAHLHVMAAGYGVNNADRRQAGSVLSLIFGLAAMLLAVAALNVANLFLARASGRAREMAMRTALGATRSRVARLLFTEAVVLAVLGALAGIVGAQWGLRVLASTFSPADQSAFANVFGINAPVLAFTFAVALFTAVLFAWAPVWRARRLDARSALVNIGRVRGRDQVRLRRVLIVGQVALSCVLLIVAALFVQTLHNARSVDLGFRADRLLLFRVDAAAIGYRPEQLLALHSKLAEELATVPGVTEVTFASAPIASNWSPNRARVGLPGQPATPNDEVAAVVWVAPRYFETYEIPVVAGRNFAPADQSPSSRVVVNETFARRLFGDENPVGRSIRMNRDKEPRLIIGVARDVMLMSLRSPAIPIVFAPIDGGAAHFAVRTAGDPSPSIAAARTAVARVDDRLPLEDVRTQTEQMARMFQNERFFVKGGLFLGLTALALVSVGLFGLMSYLVNRRTGEIGIRMALGAAPRRMLWSVLGESLTLVLVGVAIGIARAFPIAQLIAAALYGVSPTDPGVYLAMAVLLAAVAAFAALLPARRAARVDPVVALRRE